MNYVFNTTDLFFKYSFKTASFYFDYFSLKDKKASVISLI